MANKIFKEFDVSDASTPKLQKIMDTIIVGGWNKKIDKLQMIVEPESIIVKGYATVNIWKNFEERVIK